MTPRYYFVEYTSHKVVSYPPSGKVPTLQPNASVPGLRAWSVWRTLGMPMRNSERNYTIQESILHENIEGTIILVVVLIDRLGLVLSCLVSSCLVLSCFLVLPCLVLPCLVLSCLDLSRLVWSRFPLYYLFSSCLLLSCFQEDISTFYFLIAILKQKLPCCSKTMQTTFSSRLCEYYKKT